jgi:glycosyltransferase involved in cell wall biosynthesis
MERWIISAYQVFERRLLARCDFAIGPSWAVADYLSSVLGEDRVEMIANAPVAGVFSEGSRPEWAEKTILCHDGFLSDDRGMKVMLEAVRRVRQKHDIEFRVIGDAVGADKEWLNDFIRDHALENTVRITGWLPYTSVGEQLRCCHIGLIGYRRSAHKRIVFSNKVLNYMYYGLPFVAPDFVLSKQRLLREERCCILADSDSPEAYAGAICYLIEHRTEAQEMSTNALRASREKYRWEHMEPRLFGLYERITGGQIGAGAAQAHAGAV